MTSNTPSLITTSHAILRSQADDALTLTDTFADAIPHLALDVGEHPAEPDQYQLTWFLAQEGQEQLTDALQTTFNLAESLNWQPVDASIDYVAASRAAFPPLQVGPFFIARNDEPAPAGMLGLAITPNRAFGSGEHATTRGCLENYLELAANRTFTSGLDVGTGSAILALAAYRHQHTPFLGTDNDAPSVAIANENATLNNIPVGATGLTALRDEDLSHPELTTRAPFDLIFANILMLPLVELAPAISRLLAPGGALILSGFTTSQQNTVHNAYLAQGLTHHTTRVTETHMGPDGEGWCASTFIK